MLQNLITSFVAFVSTNLDDLFLLMVFFGSKRLQHMHIVLGQYLGILILVTVGIVGSLAGEFIDGRYIGLLGLFPIYLSVKTTLALIRGKENGNEDGDKMMVKSSILAMTAITIANGGDNIAVYVPLLAGFTHLEKIGFMVVFIVSVYVWCTLAKYLAEHPRVAVTLEKYSHIILPFILFLLGVFIFVENNTFSLFGF